VNFKAASIFLHSVYLSWPSVPRYSTDTQLFYLFFGKLHFIHFMRSFHGTDETRALCGVHVRPFVGIYNLRHYQPGFIETDIEGIHLNILQNFFSDSVCLVQTLFCMAV
jgi:hypothetical protein